ncbi:MAG: polysaccharide deacetylase family protein [Nitrospirota bacterium]
MNDRIVLLFHSVDSRDLSSLKNLGNINPDIFEKLISKLKEQFDIVGLKDFIETMSGGFKKRERLLAITFDDGPKSYATNAAPVMESLGVHSTCFLITDCIGDRAVYWRYLYNFCINEGYKRELADLINDEYGASISPEEIIRFTRSNYQRKKNMHIVENIFEKIVPEEEYRGKEGELFLSYDDIDKLRNNNMVGFGIHTRTHPVMINSSCDEINDEISGSLDFYRSKIKDCIPMFSVPFGRLYKDYDERTIITAGGFSIECIFSAYGGGNAKDQPLYNVRRIPVNEGLLQKGIDIFIDSLRSPAIADEYIEYEKKLNDVLSVNDKGRDMSQS